MEINGVFHIKTALCNLSSNGAAENLVRTFKNYLKKVITNSKDIETDILKFILAYNSTKHCSTEFNQTNLHLGRPLFTSFDRLTLFSKRTWGSNVERQRNCHRGNRIKDYLVGDKIMCKSYVGKEKWVDAIVVQNLLPVTYEVGVNDGSCWKRHVNQIIDNNSSNNMVNNNSTSVMSISEMREIRESTR